MEQRLKKLSPVSALRSAVPLVQHLTNYVTMNDCANITLASGASPVMIASAEEGPQMAALAGSLVVNMGTPNDESIRGIWASCTVARHRGIPVVFDPVGAGATAFRQDLSGRILSELRPSIVKGNAAEIAFLSGSSSRQRGVDSLEATAAGPVASLARASRCVAVATGEVDYVSDGESTWAIRGGNETLGRVCGSGCMMASVIASYAALPSLSRLEAAVIASLIFKCAGEAALEATGDPRKLSLFRWAFMDEVASMDDARLFSWAQGRLEAVYGR